MKQKNQNKALILASGSPRRREILSIFPCGFEVMQASCDESVPEGLSAKDTVLQLSLRKARAVAECIGCDALVIGADTLVELDGRILGKPKDAADAFSMLSSLSGRAHQVYTGFSVVDVRSGTTASEVVETQVVFRPLCEGEIDAYIRMGESMDKAGAYGIQEIGSVFVQEIKGDYFNVVGLPISKLYEVLLQKFDFDLLRRS
jgi:septum formation protein